MFVFIEILFITQSLCKALRETKLNEFGTGRSEIQYKIGCRLTGSREALELAQDGDGGFSTPRSQNSTENYDKTPRMFPESVSTSGFGGEAHACTKIFPKSKNKLIFLGTYRCSSDRWSSTSKLRISLISPDFWRNRICCIQACPISRLRFHSNFVSRLIMMWIYSVLKRNEFGRGSLEIQL